LVYLEKIVWKRARSLGTIPSSVQSGPVEKDGKDRKFALKNGAGDDRVIKGTLFAKQEEGGITKS